MRASIRILIPRSLKKTILSSFLLLGYVLTATAPSDPALLPSLQTTMSQAAMPQAAMPQVTALVADPNVNFYRDMKIRVINLDRRSDRWETFKAQAAQQHLQAYSRFPAVDGRALVMNDQLKKLFQIPRDFQGKRWRDMTHGYCKGVIGCALSHICLWEELARSNDEAYIVLEDDVLLAPDFEKRWNELYMGHLKNDAAWDFLYFGINDDTPETQKKYGDKPIYKGIMQFAPVMRREGGGTFAYCIRKKGAQKLLAIAKQQGIQQPIDHFMIDQFDTLCAYRTYPPLATALIYGINGHDTDIQAESYTYEASILESSLLQKNQAK